MTISAIVIPANEEEPIRKIVYQEGDIATMQGIVGGYFEALESEPLGVTFWCNEEAAILSVPFNRRATSMLWSGESFWFGQVSIMGDVLITGLADHRGNTLSAPADLVSTLFDSNRFRVEVKINGDPKWFQNPQRFFGYFDALNHAVSIARTWASVSGFRVSAA